MSTATMERPRNGQQQVFTETVTVKYVNPPKDGKKGNIRAAAGEYYGMSKPGLLDQFQEGETCYVDYFLTASGFRVATAKRPVVQSAPPQQQQRTAPVQQHVTPPQNGNGNGNGNGNQWYRPTHPRDSERMFVAKILGDFIQTGRISDDVDTLIRAVANLRQVYQQTFGLDDYPNEG